MHGTFIKNAIIELMRVLLINIFNEPLASPSRKEKELVKQLRLSCKKVHFEVQSNHVSEKAWKEVKDCIKKKFLMNDHREFLRWHVVLETMFAFFAPYISEELSFLRNLPDNEEVDNVTFFKDWLEKYPEFESQSWQLRCLPKNTYLMGIRGT